ncbi:hypothetical protein PVAR5_3555 [Paecilomyces variotii No. 5]|uniref:Uncharacterized protein n=1 Tax=Byssochlamys spectabilis (strain No. 5 / NBRC 109023) TaxID=1356009 RepID=V5G248_BYSSN|nr:hypothetical protein PVAR5_3555 [Paecilomyces variotii No. 5]
MRPLEEDMIFLLQPHIGGNRKVSANFQRANICYKLIAFMSGFVTQAFDIPLEEESVEALEYIGFIPSTARLIYDRYVNRPDPDRNPDDLEQYVFGHINSLGPEILTHLWNRKSALLGNGHCPDKLCYSVLSPEPSQRPSKPTHKTQEVESPSESPSGTRRVAVSSSHGNHKYDASSFPFSRGMHSIAMQSEVPPLDDHITLYKGKAEDLCPRDQAIINDDGSVNLVPLLTFPGGDTNWERVPYCWTSEKEMAEAYRQYAARRCSASETCILRIQIPWSFVRRLRKEELWSSPDWKEYIWTCRKMLVPRQKSHKLSNAERIVSHICSRMNEHVIRLPMHDVQTRMTEDDVLRLPSGRKAIQWMFSGAIAELLAREIRGKMHFDIFEPGLRSFPAAA